MKSQFIHLRHYKVTTVLYYFIVHKVLLEDKIDFCHKHVACFLKTLCYWMSVTSLPNNFGSLSSNLYIHHGSSIRVGRQVDLRKLCLKVKVVHQIYLLLLFHWNVKYISHSMEYILPVSITWN